ncbi:hypothetical protein FPCIR_10379 [Fusarium pseudocircinatum]|uniref:Uncharacterized protein n=1 Tax=Fusarium pseudocircinatum TaxID=56676 RepID=A0A8H5KYC1_9HYPO|nr:hypothetical protein FPCIR_10379 [Fusarium pseudocircinatum]
MDWAEPASTQNPVADANGQESLRGQLEEAQRRLREAENTIIGLKAAQKATQDIITAHNTDLRKENNQLREDLAVLRSQTSHASSNGNEANSGTAVNPSPEDVKNLQECLQEIKHESKEIRRQTVEIRDCVFNKQEETSRKRRRTDSDTNGNEEESPAMQFVKSCKPYNNQLTRCSVAYKGTLSPFIEDLCRAYASRTSVCHRKRRQNLEEFLNSKNTPGWHCLREVCEKGKLSTETEILSVCPHHGSDCEFLIWKQRAGQGIISFTSFGDLKDCPK